MMTYITAFIFYTLAMIGILFSGFIIYKKTFITTKSEGKGGIKILDSATIGPKKTLLVVKVRNEKFLIASGAEHTTFLAKLEENSEQQTQIAQNQKPQMYNQNMPISQIASQIPNAAAFENRQNARINNIQKQFKELYNQDNAPQNTPEPLLNRNVRVKQLLRNIDKVTSKQGARYNG